MCVCFGAGAYGYVHSFTLVPTDVLMRVLSSSVLMGEKIASSIYSTKATGFGLSISMPPDGVYADTHLPFDGMPYCICEAYGVYHSVCMSLCSQHTHAQIAPHI